VLPGGAPADQLLPSRQSPLPGLTQAFWASTGLATVSSKKSPVMPQQQKSERIISITGRA